MMCAGHADAAKLIRADAARYATTMWSGSENLLALLDGDRARLRSAVDDLAGWFTDPEGHFYHLLMLAHLGDLDRAVEMLADVVERGFFPYDTFTRHAWLEPLRDRPDFIAILEKAQRRHADARAEFIRAGGEALLGALT